MTVVEEMTLYDAVLDGLTDRESYDVERQMTSALLALCHAQQIEIDALKRRYDLARSDLERYTASMVR